MKMTDQDIAIDTLVLVACASSIVEVRRIVAHQTVAKVMEEQRPGWAKKHAEHRVRFREILEGSGK